MRAKIFCGFLSIVLCLGCFTGCGSNEIKSNSNSKGTVSETSSTTNTTTTTPKISDKDRYEQDAKALIDLCESFYCDDSVYDSGNSLLEYSSNAKNELQDIEITTSEGLKIKEWFSTYSNYVYECATCMINYDSGFISYDEMCNQGEDIYNSYYGDSDSLEESPLETYYEEFVEKAQNLGVDEDLIDDFVDAIEHFC